MRTTIIRTYSELILLPTFIDRYKYLRLGNSVAEETFGYERWLNQNFYTSAEWKRIRRAVVMRDQGCDLSISDREIQGRIYIHHVNPITKEDVINRSRFLLDPEYLISCSFDTHNAIHFGDSNLLVLDPISRTPNDTCPWKRKETISG